MAVQQGRSKRTRRGVRFGSRSVKPLSAARTKLADFFSILLQHEEEVKVIHVRAGGTGDDELMKPL